MGHPRFVELQVLALFLLLFLWLVVLLTLAFDLCSVLVLWNTKRGETLFR